MNRNIVENMLVIFDVPTDMDTGEPNAVEWSQVLAVLREHKSEIRGSHCAVKAPAQLP